MRQIHPVGFQEIFVASGIYTHFRDDKPTGLIEQWTIHELQGKAQLIRIDIDGRKQPRDGRTILLEMLCSPQENRYRVERLTLRAFGSPDDSIQRADIDHIFFGEYVEVSRKIDNHLQPSGRLDLPSVYGVFPGTMLLLGRMVTDVVSQGETEIPILTLNPHHRDETAYLPFFHSGLAVTFLTHDEIDIAGRVRRANCYNYMWIANSNAGWNGECKLWVDEYSILLRLDSPAEARQVELTRYARRPETPIL